MTEGATALCIASDLVRPASCSDELTITAQLQSLTRFDCRQACFAAHTIFFRALVRCHRTRNAFATAYSSRKATRTSKLCVLRLFALLLGCDLLEQAIAHQLLRARFLDHLLLRLRVRVLKPEPVAPCRELRVALRTAESKQQSCVDG